MTINWEQYLPELKLLLGAAILVLVLSVIAPLLTKLLTRIASPFSFARDLLERIKPPINLLIPLLGLRAYLGSADDDFHFIDIARHINSLFIIATKLCPLWGISLNLMTSGVYLFNLSPALITASFTSFTRSSSIFSTARS